MGCNSDTTQKNTNLELICSPALQIVLPSSSNSGIFCGTILHQQLAVVSLLHSLLCYVQGKILNSFISELDFSSCATIAAHERYDGHMITGDECDPNFLAFILRLRENPGKIQTGNWPDRGSNPVPCVRSNDVTSRPQRWSHWKLILLQWNSHFKWKKVTQQNMCNFGMKRRRRNTWS